MKTITFTMLVLLTLAACTNTAQVTNPQANQPPSGRFNRTGFHLDYTGAAEKLGITVDDLHNALGDANGGRPNFVQAAQTLNVTVEQLRTDLGLPANFTRGNLSRRGTR